MEAFHLYFDEQINKRLRGVSRMDSLNIILERSEKQYTQAEKDELAAVKNSRYVELLQNLTPNDVLPGMRCFLKSCHDRGLKTALASASKNAPFIIKKLELEDEFDYIADAAKVKNSKPADDIYLAAAEGLKIDPSVCIGIEDAEAGIEAIHAAGMKAIGIGSIDFLASLKEQREKIAARLRKDQTVQLHVHTMEAALDGMSHLMQQWDEEMIRQLVHTVKVISADHIKVYLCNGIEIDQTVNP